MRFRPVVLVVLLVGLAVAVYFLFFALPAARRAAPGYVVERVTRGRFQELTAWDVPIEQRLGSSLALKPNYDRTLFLYQTGVNGSEVRLWDGADQGDKLIYRLSGLSDSALVFDYRVEAFWLGTYAGVVITEFGGEVGPYRVFHYDVASGTLRELPVSLFTHPELNLNSEGVLGSPPGSQLLVVESADDAQDDGLYLCSVSGERAAKIYSGPRGSFRYVGSSDKAVLYSVANGGPQNDLGEVGSSIYLYDLESRSLLRVPATGTISAPAFRPGTNAVTFVERDPGDGALYLREYEPGKMEQAGALLKLAEGESYCWSVDGQRLFVIGEGG